MNIYKNNSSENFFEDNNAPQELMLNLEKGDESLKNKTDEYIRNPQNLNSYSYTINSPLGYIDPDGKWYINVSVSGGYVLGAGVGVMIGDKGVYSYAGAGLTTPGAGVGLTFSTSDPAAGESLSVGAQAYGAYSYSQDLATGESSHEFGVGYPPGASIFVVKTIELKAFEESK